MPNNGLRNLPETSDAKSGSLGDETGSIDADLAEIVEAWPDLPDTVRGAVLQLVREAAGKTE